MNTCKMEKVGDELVCPACKFRMPYQEKPVVKPCPAAQSAEGDAMLISSNESPPQQYPTVKQMAINLAQTAVSFVASGFRFSPGSVFEERLRICQGDRTRSRCESYDPDQKRCVGCGCYQSIKAQIQAASCPKGKWPK